MCYSPWGCKELDTTEQLNNCSCLHGGSDGKESACNSGDSGSIPGLGIHPREGNDNPLQYSCLENSVDREEPGGLRSVGSQRIGLIERLTQHNNCSCKSLTVLFFAESPSKKV